LQQQRALQQKGTHGVLEKQITNEVNKRMLRTKEEEHGSCDETQREWKKDDGNPK